MDEITVNDLIEREKIRRERIRKQNESFNKRVDRLTFTVPAGQKEVIRDAAEKAGYASMNEFLSHTVLEKTKRILKKKTE